MTIGSPSNVVQTTTANSSSNSNKKKKLVALYGHPFKCKFRNAHSFILPFSYPRKYRFSSGGEIHKACRFGADSERVVWLQMRRGGRGCWCWTKLHYGQVVGGWYSPVGGMERSRKRMLVKLKHWRAFAVQTTGQFSGDAFKRCWVLFYFFFNLKCFLLIYFRH